MQCKKNLNEFRGNIKEISPALTKILPTILINFLKNIVERPVQIILQKKGKKSRLGRGLFLRLFFRKETKN